MTVTGQWSVLARYGAAVALGGLVAGSGQAQVSAIDDINPDFSDTDAADPDGATGGRINGLATVASDKTILYAASEWGGIYKSTDSGLRWSHLDGHRPTVTWDVEVDPGNASRVFATSFYDGRVSSLSGINVSNDAGVTWAHPASAVPPSSFCANPDDRTELQAFGISIDPAANQNVFIGTSCGLAKSTDSGATWAYIDPTPPNANRVWDVIAHGGGVVDVCGDDGHLRSTDGGSTWTAGSGLPSGRCSLAVSPDESYVLFAAVGISIYETDNANAAAPTWANTRTNPTPQGRIPFVATNDRTPAGNFDLWFGDVSLFRAACTTPAVPAPGGAARCGTGTTPAWSGPFTRSAGGHDDTADIAFDPSVAVDACPSLMSSDGGVYYNTLTSSPSCHDPAWEQPMITPHGLWLWAMAGTDKAGATFEDLHFGNQDNGVFGSADAGAATPGWTNPLCCDGFDAVSEANRVLWSVCCFSPAPSTRFFLSGPAFSTARVEINTYPGGGLPPGFQAPDAIDRWGDKKYAMITRDSATDGGVFITSDITASPIVWTELGNATEPPSNLVCGVKASVDALSVPTFYVQTGSCNATGTTDRMFKFTGTNPAASWTEITLPSGGFGVAAVHPTKPTQLMASAQTTTTADVYRSTDGGLSWAAMAPVNTLMTGSGVFKIRSLRGPSNFTGFSGYWQPSLLAFDPTDDNILVAGGKDSGIFLSLDGGATFTTISDPLTSHTSGIPHIPRPWYAYFDAEAGLAKRIVVGTQGRGVWRFTLDTNDAPSCAPGGPYQSECADIAMSVTVADPNQDDISYSWSSSNANVTVVPATGLVPGGLGPQALLATAKLNPAAAACGVNATVTLTVDDGQTQSTCDAMVTFDDTTAPTLSGVPANTTVECNAVPAVATPTAMDNCDTAVAITFAETRSNGSCVDNYTLTRAWTATDDCGNATMATQVIIVRDTTPPTLAGVPANVTVECDAVPVAATPTATDNCDAAVAITFAEVRTDGSCLDNYTLTRTWTATDNCGNVTTATQVVTVVDTTDPIVLATLTPITPRSPLPPHEVCLAPSSRGFTVDYSATDNCDPAPVVDAVIRVVNHDVLVKSGGCVDRIEDFPVMVGEVVEIRLIAPPCPTHPTKKQRPAMFVNSLGIKVFTGENVTLVANAVDRCGNAASAMFDPVVEPSPLCDEVLIDLTCCPALGSPPDPKCRVPLCGR